MERDAERSSERRYSLRKSDSDEFTYSVQLASKFKEGNNELVIQAKSPTVEREIHHQFKVYTSPAEIKISENHGKYQVEVKPYLSILRPKSIKINIELKDKSKHTLNQHDKRWLVDVDKEFEESIFTINIEAKGLMENPSQ